MCGELLSVVSFPPVHLLLEGTEGGEVVSVSVLNSIGAPGRRKEVNNMETWENLKTYLFVGIARKEIISKIAVTNSIFSLVP